MGQLITKPRGTQDFLPPQSEALEIIKERIKEIFWKHGYQPIETPIFEHTELFMRLGESTDIVQKEMYTFQDKKGRSLTLRPEITAPVVRAFLEAGLDRTSDIKRFFYIGPIFRYEKPQKGRYRQAHQFGIEVLGSDSPAVDFEVITVAMKVYKAFGLEDLKVSLNSIGCRKCRPKYREALMEYLKPKISELCSDCQRRYTRNPLRVLDCKVDRGKLTDAPKTLDYLCEDCKAHFQKLLKYLDKAGVNYEIDHHLVRGLDYYSRTVFEIRARIGDRELELAGGGRYDYLAEEIGGKNVPGCGFAGGLERLYMILEQENLLPTSKVRKVVIAPISERAEELIVELLPSLTPSSQVLVAWGSTLKKALKYGDRVGADEVAFFGDRELEEAKFIVRDLHKGVQRELPISELKGYLEEG